MDKLSILVVLYNKELLASNTIRSLIKHDYENKCNLVVWNNGPHEVDKIDIVGYEYELVQTISNISLATIYNRFIKNNDSERYAMFDDDSLLTKEYYDVLFESKKNVVIPRIEIQGRCYYPKNRNKSIYNVDISEVNPSNIVSIGSGISISKVCALTFLHEFGNIFDERFVLYGVDVTFFYRLSKLGKFNVNVHGRIIHSLSRLEKESITVENFRTIERCYDLALQNRYYFSFQTLKSAVNFLLKMVLSKKFTIIQRFLKVYILGKHPRNR